MSTVFININIKLFEKYTDFVLNVRSTLHAPGGVLGAVRTPLHAVLGMLRPEAGGGNAAASLTSRPKLCEAAYRYVQGIPSGLRPWLG